MKENTDVSARRSPRLLLKHRSSPSSPPELLMQRFSLWHIIQNKLQYLQNSAALLLTPGSHRPCSSEPSPAPRLITDPPQNPSPHSQSPPQTGPASLTGLLRHHAPSRRLRSSDANLLSSPQRTVTGHGGDGAFSISTPPSGPLSPNSSETAPTLRSPNHKSKPTCSQLL